VRRGQYRQIYHGIRTTRMGCKQSNKERQKRPPRTVHERGFSYRNVSRSSPDIGIRCTFFSFHKARRPTPDTLTILKRTPGISPLALPRRPKPEMRTSSFSSTKFKQPSFYDRHTASVIGSSRNLQSTRRGQDHRLLTGTKAVTFLPFLMSCTRTHFRIAELGCLASTPTFSRTIPLACEEPPVGEVL
jgi:hypothetical protein